MVADRPGRPPPAGPGHRDAAGRHGGAAGRAGRGLRGRRPRLRAGQGGRRLPLPEPSRSAPATSSASCSRARPPGCRPPRSRRWPSSPTSSRSPGRRSPPSAASTSTAWCARSSSGATSPRCPRPRSRPGRAVRHDRRRSSSASALDSLDDLPADRRVRARAPTWSRRSSTACASTRSRSRWRPSRSAADDDGAPEPTDHGDRHADRPRRPRLTRGRATTRVNGCRRSWRARGSAAGGSARTSSPTVGSRSTARSPILGRRVDVERDLVEIDGAAIGVRPGLVYYLLNKPTGVVTTADDPQGRPTVVDLVPRRAARVPGRAPRPRHRGSAAADQRRRADPPADPSVLSASTRSTSPTSSGRPTRAELRRLREGVELDDGITAPAQVSAGRAGPAAHRDPRGPQPPGPPHVRGHRPSGAAARAQPHRPAHRPQAEAGRVARADHRRGAGPRAGRVGARPRRRPGRGPRGRRSSIPPCPTPSGPSGAPPPSTRTPPSRCATRTVALLAEMLAGQRDRPRRPDQRHLHRHRRHPLDVPGPGGPGVRTRRRAAALRPRARHRRGHAASASGS